MGGSESRGGTCSRVNRREGHQGDHQKDDSTYPPLRPKRMRPDGAVCYVQLIAGIKKTGFWRWVPVS